MMPRITRRRFLGETARAVAAASVVGGGLVLNGCSSRKDFDLVIKDGLVYDGLGNPGLVTDIGISRDLIKYLGKISYSRGRAVLEARGLAVAPGFIDVHDHSDVQLLVNPKAESAVHQGITTTISGNCGSSPFPIADEIFEQEKDSLKKRYEIDLTWRDIRGFFSRIEEKGIALNYGTLVGQGAIRGAAMGFNDRAPKPAELEKMKALVSENLKNGALGLSSGLEYTPGSFAQPDELVELCKIVALAGGVYATHMRDEGDTLIESLMETIDVAKKSGVSVQISHFKVAYPRNWGKIDAAIVKIEEAKKDGVDIFCDRYPYIAGATSLDFNFPLWARQGTTEEFLSRLKDPYQDAKLRSYIAEREKKLESWDKVVISYVLTEKNRKFEGKNILEASREAGKPPYEFMRDLLIEENDQVGIVIFMMKEENLTRILAHPLVGIGTDGEARAPYGLLGRGKPHPRVYGTFPRAIGKYVREEKLLKLEEMLKKMTSVPARRFGLQKRGVVRAENIADLVIFDPDKIIDKATWKEPHQYPAGVEYVLVNGEIVIDKGSHTGKLPGKILRKKSAL
ncbi:MAG: D-aminoacylase [Candidatus Aminicenantes bacterium]|nr:D-aminoacylase [Candidatus Aminicenantes bacterium]